MTTSRDAAICVAYAAGNTTRELAEECGLTHQRISQILKVRGTVARTRHRPPIRVACRLCGAPFRPRARRRLHQQGYCAQACRRADNDRVARAFWARVVKSDGCWLWQGAVNRVTGYGAFYGFSGGTRMAYAHRVAWQLTNGPLPEGLLVCHTCDNRPCVRPDHLFLAPNPDTARDRDRKGRARPGGRIPKTHYG